MGGGDAEAVIDCLLRDLAKEGCSRRAEAGRSSGREHCLDNNTKTAQSHILMQCTRRWKRVSHGEFGVVICCLQVNSFSNDLA